MTESPLVLYAPRSKMVLILLGCIAAVALGIWIISKPDVPMLTKILGGWLGVVFFGGGSLLILHRLIRNAPSVTLDSVGITFPSPVTKAERIPWSEIEYAEIFCFGSWPKKQEMLGFVLRNPEITLARENTLTAGLGRLSAAMVGYHGSIPQSLVSIPLEDLLKHINKHLTHPRG